MSIINRLIAAVSLSLMVCSVCYAVDMAATFGAGGSDLSVSPQLCQIEASHNGAMVSTPLVLTANGTDSASVQIVCNGVSQTITVPSLTVVAAAGPVTKTNVAFPVTVTSSSAGSWNVVIPNIPPFLIVAQ